MKKGFCKSLARRRAIAGPWVSLGKTVRREPGLGARSMRAGGRVPRTDCVRKETGPGAPAAEQAVAVTARRGWHRACCSRLHGFPVHADRRPEHGISGEPADRRRCRWATLDRGEHRARGPVADGSRGSAVPWYLHQSRSQGPEPGFRDQARSPQAHGHTDLPSLRRK
jgi:hypothetical protein